MVDTRTNGLSLGTVIFLVAALLVLLAVGLPAVINYNKGAKAAEQEIEQALSRSRSSQSYIQRQRGRELELITEFLAEDPEFSGYIEESLDAGLFGDLEVSSDSINDQLTERRDSIGYDVSLILDTEGLLMGHSERDFDEEWFDEVPMVATVLDTLEPATGLWNEGENYFQVSMVPMSSGFTVFAILGAGLLIDQSYAEEIKQVTGAEQLWMTEESVIASTLPLNETEQLVARLREMNSASDDETGDASSSARLLLPSGEWAVSIEPFSGMDLGLTSVSLVSVDQVLATQRAEVQNLVIGAAGALVLGLLLSLFLARWIARPVAQLATSATVASGGEYDVETSITGTREVKQLGDAFDRLLNDLKDKQDMEEYVADLSRYLPDPTVDHSMSSVAETAIREPERARLALIAMDFMRFDQHLEGDANQRIRTFQGLLAQAAEISHTLGGRLESIFGHRAVVGFTGHEAVEHALMFASQMVSRESRQHPSMALVYGDVDHGVVRAGASSGGVVLGKTSAQLDQLLQDANIGQLLMSPTAREQIINSETLDISPTIQKGRLSGKKYYALNRVDLSNITVDTQISGDGEETTRMDSMVSDNAAIDIFPGDILADRYDILSVLGRGGMGRVFKAWDKELQDFVAVKTLLPEIARNTQYLEQLKDEIKLARKITHVNVVRTYDFGSYQNVPYITMEYVRGMTLRYLMKQRSRLPFSAGLRICRQVGAGLAVAHEQAVVHRDLKPENIILEANGNAKLMDFGLAGPVDKLNTEQASGMFMGTPLYAAPEQMTGSDLTPASDIYAFGVMMYELFLGQKPFVSNAEMLDIYQAKVAEDYLAPSSHWEDIPDSLTEMIATCLKHDISERYSNAMDLMRALQQVRS